MAKRGCYSNDTKKQADVFIDMMDGDVNGAFNLAFDRAEMFWEDDDRDEKDVQGAVNLTNYLALKAKRET
jgi:hypothetical protein